MKDRILHILANIVAFIVIALLMILFLAFALVAVYAYLVPDAPLEYKLGVILAVLGVAIYMLSCLDDNVSKILKILENQKGEK